MERWSQSAWHRSVYLAAAFVALGWTLGVGPLSAAVTCVGDCNGDGKVTVDEGITVAAIDIGDKAPSACPFGVSGSVGIDTVVKAAGNEISGCAPPRCGNGSLEPGEECDIGGTCIGNAKAGMHCTSDADCGGSTVGGVCESGDKAGAVCASNTDCPPSSVCIRCKTFEGNTKDGVPCAANCTFEHSLVFNLKPGIAEDPMYCTAAGVPFSCCTGPATGDTCDALSVAPGTSGAVVHGEVLNLPLPIGEGCVGGSKNNQPCASDGDCPDGGKCEPATQTFGVGKDRGDGVIPLVVKSASVRFPQIDVGGLACACVRGVSQKSCGGTVFESDGTTETPFCTANFGVCDMTSHCMQLPSVSCTTNADCEGDTFCTKAHLNPCAFVHGDGNSASGFASCSDAGIQGINYLYTRDAGGCSDPPACTMRTPKAPAITFSGMGPKGSALLLNTTAIGTAVGACSGTDKTIYGDDGQICTDDDPQASRGTPQTIPLTTGQASSEVFHANFSQSGPTDVTVCNTMASHCSTTTTQSCAADSDCPGGQTCVCPPYTSTGNPFNCTALEQGMFPGGGLVSAFVSLNQPQIGDIAVVSQFYALQ